MSAEDVYGLSGQVLDGQFRVDAVVGEGGFSVVYRGRHLGLDEPVAIKCLKLQGGLGTAIVETFVRRFRDESKIQYRLAQGSLHVARTIAAGTTMSQTTHALVPYMVLEWLDGYTLAEHLRARRERGERGRSIAETMEILEPVMGAIAFAHSLGIVHRDLTPSNIFLEVQPGGAFRPKVMDFGVAKVVSDHALSFGPRAATLGHIRLFTPAYGAPEQFDEKRGPIGPAADVYALALLGVEVLTDRTPISGEHLGDYYERAIDPVNRPTPRALGASVGDSVEAVFRRALDVEPLARPKDAGEFAQLLAAAIARDQTGTKRPSVPAGAPLTSKGTVILTSPSAESPSFAGSRGPPIARPVARGATQPLAVHAAPVIDAPAPSPQRDPFVDPYGPTAEGGGPRGASPLSSTMHTGGGSTDARREPIAPRVVVNAPPPRTAVVGPANQPPTPSLGDEPTYASRRADPPIPEVRGKGSNGAVVVVAITAGVIALAGVAWAFVHFVL